MASISPRSLKPRMTKRPAPGLYSRGLILLNPKNNQYKDGTQIKFEDGTFREDIWHWFEETFNISVAVDLMY